MRFSVEYLRAASRRPEIARLKRLSYEKLELLAGGRVLDIGCGPAIDTIELAKMVGPDGLSVGVDQDPDLIRIADVSAAEAGLSPENIKHFVVNAEALPFPGNHFDAVRCERLTQHLTVEAAANVVAEACRVTRPGGTCVFLDTDWASLSIHSNAVALERILVSLHLNSWQNGFAARAVGQHLSNRLMELDPPATFPIPLDREELLFLLSPTLQAAQRAGTIHGSLGSNLDIELASAKSGAYYYAVVNFVMWSAHKPK